MALRYYPLSRVKTGLVTSGKELYLNGKSYVGKYYETFDGKYFTGENPVIGDNLPLSKLPQFVRDLGDLDPYDAIEDQLPIQLQGQNIANYRLSKKANNKPVSYFPMPLEEDYTRGYIQRYFVKRINDAGFVIEISPEEYSKIKDGTVNYDVSFYLTGELTWRLIGPLKTIRLSQYDIRVGIEDFNKKQVETLNKTFLGITDFINNDYIKFARPTQ